MGGRLREGEPVVAMEDHCSPQQEKNPEKQKTTVGCSVSKRPQVHNLTILLRGNLYQ